MSRGLLHNLHELLSRWISRFCLLSTTSPPKVCGWEVSYRKESKDSSRSSPSHWLGHSPRSHFFSFPLNRLTGCVVNKTDLLVYYCDSVVIFSLRNVCHDQFFGRGGAALNGVACSLRQFQTKSQRQTLSSSHKTSWSPKVPPGNSLDQLWKQK